MIQTDTLTTKIAQLEYQRGHFLESLSWADQLAKDSLTSFKTGDYLEALRLLLFCSYELEDLNPFEDHLQNLRHYIETESGKHKATAQYLFAHYLSIKQSAETEEAISYSISLAASVQNLDYLARSLALAAYYYCVEPNRNYSKATQYLDKADILIKELEMKDLNIHSLVLRSYANGGRGQFERAFELAWKAYEAAQLNGHQVAMPAILIQIARLYRQQNRQDFFQMYAELALRAVNLHQHPRMFRQISEFHKFYSAKPLSVYDFFVHEKQKVIKERYKGTIDFKNQHIILDLALLFLKNPGIRFTKEELIEMIWKQVYDPENHDNLIYVSIKRLRILIEPNVDSPKYILRDRFGYYLNSQTQIQFEDNEGGSI